MAELAMFPEATEGVVAPMPVTKRVIVEPLAAGLDALLSDPS